MDRDTGSDRAALPVRLRNQKCYVLCEFTSMKFYNRQLKEAEGGPGVAGVEAEDVAIMAHGLQGSTLSRTQKNVTCAT